MTYALYRLVQGTNALIPIQAVALSDLRCYQFLCDLCDLCGIIDTVIYSAGGEL